MRVFILVANNSADFKESDIQLAGASQELVEKGLNTVLTNRWNGYLNEEDKEFYGTFDKYKEVWYTDITICELLQ